MNRKSLLTVGIRNVEGNFSTGEVVQLINAEEKILGVAKVKLNAKEMQEQIAHRNIVAAHADDIVLF
jgi:glutamate 5-kinase